MTAADRLTVGQFMMRRWSLERDVRALERLGFQSISVASSKLQAYGTRRGLALLRASSLQVAHVLTSGVVAGAGGRGQRGAAEVRRAIEWGHTLGARVVVAIAGPRGTRSWRQAAEDCVAGLRALLPEAAAAGVRLAFEVIHPLRQDLSFVNTVRDAARIVRRAGAGAGYVLDTWHSGWEPDVLERIDLDGARRIHAVQLSDWKRVTLRSMDRAMLGYGILPLRTMLSRLERAGYDGWYELEIISDDVEHLGYERALTRSRAAFARLMREAQRR